MNTTIRIEDKITNIVLVGVGGQGTILASNVLAELGVALDYDVKKAEVHGMSQRGGSVISHVRWGPQVFSPIITTGEADILVAFEKLEAARYAALLKPGGIALINAHRIAPITVSAGVSLYPEDAAIENALAGVTDHIHQISGAQIAEQIGNVKTANVVILGALSALMPTIPIEPWLAVIEKRVPPRFVELNRLAFAAGRKAAPG